ncbi:MAG TPA: hypothetical protein VFU13_17370 [Steroidobacteraceae bacterium]|nr:hypothetical protein [Steroidobacteraceae bacterium]
MKKRIASVVRAHWKQFVWIWLFPILFFASIFLPASERNLSLFVYAIVFPVLILCVYIASKPLRDRLVPLGQGIFLIFIVPFLIWVILIFALFGLYAAFKAISA